MERVPVKAARTRSRSAGWMGGQLLKINLACPGQAPQIKISSVHGETGAVDIPRPQGHARRVNRLLEMLKEPDL